MQSKTCFKCGQHKTLEEFYVHKMMRDGHLNKCKECCKAYVQKWYDDTFEDRRAYEKKRFQKPERKAKLIQYQRKRRKANPEKDRARLMLNRAVRAHKIMPLPCQRCGDTKSQAHHHDYSKPLDVEWLCFKCHRLEHGQQNVVR